MSSWEYYMIPEKYEKSLKRDYTEAQMRDHVVLKKLGEGCFGHVTLVKLKKKGALVALKRVPKSKGKPEVEYKNMKKIIHPFIIQYYGYFECENFYNFALEFAPNGDLAHKIAERQATMTYWSEHEICKMLGDMVVGLEFLHENGIVHRDLKPDNIVIGADNVLKITDFGVAKVMEATGNESLYASKCGAKCYAAPELLHGRKYDSSVDIWSLGVMVYEMCSLKHPFIDKFPAAKNVPRIPAQYSKMFALLVKWMLDDDPDERPCAETLKGEQEVEPHYKAAVYRFTSYFEMKMMEKAHYHPDYVEFSSDVEIYPSDESDED